MTENTIIARCTICSSEFTEEQINNNKKPCCPACGTKSLPCSTKNDVTIQINWHELRILVMWAENYAVQTLQDKDSQRTIEAISERIRRQHPEKKQPLMLRDELRMLKSAFPGAEVVGRDLGPNLKVVDGGFKEPKTSKLEELNEDIG